MSSRPALGSTLLFAAALALVACGEVGPPRPNVLLVVVDTLRADRLGTYGYGRETSPHLDAFAERAVVFEQAITSAPWTTPAVAALLTGAPPAEIGVKSKAVVLPQTFTTLAEALHELGYATSGIVSHLFVGAKLGFDQGFDVWNEEHARGHEYVSSAEITDLAIDYLRGRATAEEPFFLFLHYFDPHYDYVAQDYPDLVRPSRSELASERDNIARLRRRAAAGRYSEEDVRHLNDLYDSEVRYTDEHLGRLLDELERGGLFEDTLVIVTADHGEALMDRPDRWIGHTRTLFQELVHVPLIVKPAGPFRPRRVAPPVTTLDVLPTVLHQLDARLPGLPDPAQRSLLGELVEAPRFAATYRDVELQMVRHGRWKLVHDRPSGRNWLFDLEADPGELEDVSSERPDVLARLERARREWHEPRFARLLELVADEPDLTADELQRLEALGY